MKRTVNTALAAAMLLCLALAGQAAAQPPPATDDSIDAPLWEDEISEDEAEVQAAEEESQLVEIDSTEEAPPDEFSNATIVEEDMEEDGTAAAEGNASESRNFKDQLKRMLLGVLMPAVERRAHKAVGNDDEAQSELDSEP